MAIDAYVGKPGHGKSYGVVEHVVIPSLKQGRHVVTNIPLNRELLLLDFGGSVEQLPDNWFEIPELSDYIPCGSVLILDEIWRRWPKGQKSNQASISDKALLAEHRHRVDELGNSMRVILVTQDLSQIAAWTYPLVETTYRVKKYSKTLYRVDVYDGCVTGDSPPKSRRTRQTAGKFDKRVFGYYSSATQSKSGGVGDETTADGRASLLRSWGLWLLISVVLFGGLLAFFGLKSFFQGSSSPEVVKPVSGQSAARPNPTPKIDHPMSTEWRIQGVVHAVGSGLPGNSLVALANKSGKLRYVSFSSHCRYYDDFREIYCIVDGSRVTSWSSSSGSFGGTLLGDGVQRSVNIVSQ